MRVCGGVQTWPGGVRRATAATRGRARPARRHRPAARGQWQAPGGPGEAPRMPAAAGASPRLASPQRAAGAAAPVSPLPGPIPAGRSRGESRCCAFPALGERRITKGGCWKLGACAESLQQAGLLVLVSLFCPKASSSGGARCLFEGSEVTPTRVEDWGSHADDTQHRSGFAAAAGPQPCVCGTTVPESERSACLRSGLAWGAGMEGGKRSPLLQKRMKADR